MVYNKRFLALLLFVCQMIQHIAFCAGPIIHDQNKEQAVALADIGASEAQMINAQIENRVHELGEELKKMPKVGKIQLSEEQQEKLKNGLPLWTQTEDGEDVMVGTIATVLKITGYGALIGSGFTSVILGSVLGAWIYSLRNNIDQLQRAARKDLNLRREIIG